MLKKATKILAVMTFSILVTACGQKTLYTWKGYDYALLKHYKDSSSTAELAESLKKIIEKSEAKKQVPPGIYAEYAYALYDSGNVEDALIYFNKERQLWPESEPFMTDVINRISGNT